jgi:hypothetical protein
MSPCHHGRVRSGGGKFANEKTRRAMRVMLPEFAAGTRECATVDNSTIAAVDFHIRSIAL